MHEEYQKFWTPERKSKAEQIDLTPAQVSILASIVDAEALHDTEMPTIAGLYMNRYKRGMPFQADPTVIFAEEFTRLQGKFAYCIDKENLQEQLIQLFNQKSWTKVWFKELVVKNLLDPFIESFDDLANCDVSVTGCESLVARTGTIVLSAKQADGRTGSVYAPVHICIAFTSQMTFDIKDTLMMMKQKYDNNLPSLISFASGPSRTADIEKTLVMGAHGPKQLVLFLIDDLPN